MPNRRRRLLVVSQPPVAGVPRHVLDLLDGLDPAVWDVTVMCPTGTDLWEGIEGNPDVRRLPMPAARGASPRDLVTVARLIPQVRAADVVHAHSSKAGWVVRLACLLTGRTRRCVFTPHGWSFWAFGGAAGKTFEVVERIAARWCAQIIAVSRYERDAGLAAGVGDRSRYTVVPNGIDLEKFSAPPRPVPGRVVMVARLAPPKLPSLAVEAIALVRKQVPAAHLFLVGDGPLRDEVEAEIALRGAQDAVTLLGTRLDVPDQLAAASVALHASRYEGCPLTVLEAMAAGVPVVATPAGGVDELIDDTTGAIAGFDAPALAGAVVTLLTDDARRADAATCARARARERYGRERMVTATLDIYERVMGGTSL